VSDDGKKFLVGMVTADHNKLQLWVGVGGRRQGKGKRDNQSV
jgi:hypothetical protein